MNVLINDNLISDTFKNFIYSHEHELNKILKAIGDDFYPSAENVLRFARVDIDKIKVIILGMDPYPSSYIIEAGSSHLKVLLWRALLRVTYFSHYFFAALGLLAPYFERACFLSATPAVSNVPRMM